MRTRRGGASGSRFAAHKSRVISVSVHTPTRGPMASGGGPSYDVTFSTAPVAEGDAITFTILANGVPNNTVMYWKNTGTTTAADFVENVNEGYVTIRNGRASFTLTTRADFSEEGDETVRIEFFTHENVAATGPLTVPDTSLAPVYYITSSPGSVSSETDALTFTVTTANVANDTVLYWKNIGTTTAADFNENINQGNVTINDSTASFTLTLNADQLAEGPETIVIGIYTDSGFTNLVALSGSITVPDTSADPFTPARMNNIFQWYDGRDPLATGTPPANNTSLNGWINKVQNGGYSLSPYSVASNPTYIDQQVYFFGNRHFRYPGAGAARGFDFYFVGKPLGNRGIILSASGLGPLMVNGFNELAVKTTYAAVYSNTPLVTLGSNTLMSCQILNTSGSNMFAGVNGQTVLGQAPASFFMGLNTFGNAFEGTYSFPWGHVSEYVHFNSNLSTADRQKIEGYLAWRWSLQGNLPSDHPYKSAAPV